ncbi:MAG: tetratricopeptide repeat protein [Prevotella sp.]|jgi:tetratricopeptide (TPR) repeat protein
MRATRWTHYIVAVVFLLLLPCSKGMAQTSDGERLGMALEYFQSEKYHEALLILQKLDRKYRLNPRIRAYIGVCYYYEWEYAQATEYLDSVIPQLKAFAPQERSFYYYADAESHFNLRQFGQALPLYNEMLKLCRDNEKPDAYYRIGFIHVYRHEWIDALDNLQSALVYYQCYRPDEKARIAQIRNMINGCCTNIKNGG